MRFFYLMLCFFLCATIMSGVTSHSLHRHLLHHYPFFPLDSSSSSSSAPSLPPQPSPEQPTYPFTSTTTSNPYPFFPSNPPPPPSSPSAVASFPANISSLIFPSSTHHHRHSNKLLTILISSSLSAFALLFLLALLFILYRCISSRNAVVSHKPLRSVDSEHTPSQTETTTTTTTTSDGSVKMFRPPPLRNGRGIIGTSTEFLYLGTVSGNSSSEINSPELRPLPPLPKFNPFISGEQIITPRSRTIAEVNEEFFSPRGSSSSGTAKFVERSRSVNSKTASFQSSNSTSPTLSVSDRTPVFVLRSPSLSSSSAEFELGRPFATRTRLSHDESMNLPPHQSSFSNSYPEVLNVEAPQITKLTLKPLHWAKMRASSEKAIAWDDIKSTSFVLNEEIRESMYAKSTNPVTDDKSRWNPENCVLDCKKSQNIEILLRASNITIDEICEGLIEGNADALGSELLECLLKMAPSKECKESVREFDNGSQSKFGPDEKFLKVLLDIPYAFERMDAMLYMTRFDSEVEYLTESFQTLQAACCELKTSQMFLKLLEAVLKAGYQINVGINSGDARACKLDTLLKLVDEKGIDGKTTVLHFVVEEMITGEDRSRTLNLGSQQGPQDKVDSRKHNLQVVTSVIGELSNVKKVAEINFTILSSEVEKLANQTCKVRHILELAEEIPANMCKFLESIAVFLNKAEAEITRIRVQQNTAFTLVNEVNEYFNGDYSKQDANPFRIFLVVRDFLSVLDRVCKEVGKRNMRTVLGIGNVHSLYYANQNPPSSFPPFNRMQQSFTGTGQGSSSMNYGLTHSSSI